METLRVYNTGNEDIAWQWEEGFESSIGCGEPPAESYWIDGGARYNAGSSSSYEGTYVHRGQGSNGVLYHTGISELTNWTVQGFVSLTSNPTGELQFMLGVCEQSDACTDNNSCEADCNYTVSGSPTSFGFGGVIAVFDWEDGSPPDTVSVYASDSNDQNVYYDDSYPLPSPFNGYFDGSTGGAEGEGYGSGDWIGARVTLNDDIIRIYMWASGHGNWVLVYTSTEITWTTNGNIRPTMTCPGINTDLTGSDVSYLDAWKYGPPLAEGDYLPTKMEFYLEESSIGGGYMFIPERNANFASYYNLQETEFIISDSAGNPLFYGMFLEPIKVKDGVRLNFREVSYQLHDHFCKRDYNLQKGKIKDVGTI